jgi:hypothetical protein
VNLVDESQLEGTDIHEVHDGQFVEECVVSVPMSSFSN